MSSGNPDRKPAARWLRPLLEPAAILWRWTRELAHGLRVASVATVSVVIGVLMYRYVDQVHDLFLEVTGDRLHTTVFWLLFYLAVIGAWALPVYLSARYILARYNSLAERSAEDDLIPVQPWVVRMVPPLLGTLCLVAVLIGQWEAITEAPLATRAGCSLQNLRPCVDREIFTWAKVDRLEAEKEAGFATLNELEAHRRRIEEAQANARELALKQMQADGYLFYRAVFGIATTSAGLAAAFLILLLCLTGVRAAIDRIGDEVLYARARSGFWGALIAAVAGIAGLLAVTSATGRSTLAIADDIRQWSAWPGEKFAEVLTYWLVSAPDKGGNSWPEVAGKIHYMIFTAVGQKGIVLILVLLLLASPLTLYSIWRLRPRIATIAHRWLRIEAWLIAWCVVVAVVILDLLGIALLIMWGHHIADEMRDDLSIIGLAGLPPLTALAALGAWKALRRHSQRAVEIGAFGRAPAFYIGLLAASSAGILILLLANPLWITDYIARAPLFPIILGIWVPALTLLTAYSYRDRVPYIICAMLLIGIVSLLFGDPHNIRIAEQRPAEPPNRPTFEQSLARWAVVNNCIVPPADTPDAQIAADKRCPQPIIVLAAGGASRSAFMVATVLGELMDRANGLEPGRDGVYSRAAGERAVALRMRTRAFNNQVFAISGVSGGALAAVTFQAALLDAQRTSADRNVLAPPCDRARTDSLWYGKDRVTARRVPAGAEAEVVEPDLSWRSCLQLLVTGDYLSPSAIPLLGSDLLGMSLFGDRSVALERSWERRYQRIVGQPTLAESVGGLRNKALVDLDSWLPILLLNGTSVETGRRIITTDVSFLASPQAAGGSDLDFFDMIKATFRQVIYRNSFQFDDSFDLHGRLKSSRPASRRKDAYGGCETCDIRLSTAATMSARFPILSPHGTIRNASDGVADRVVDGGYFENFGAVTAHELTAMLKSRARLNPIILLITNDPGTPEIDCGRGDYPIRNLRAAERTTASMLSSPARAFMSTRSARGSLAAVALCREVGDRNFIHFGVRVEEDPLFGATQLSMSWWLSKHVQRKLADVRANTVQYNRVERGLRK